MSRLLLRILIANLLFLSCLTVTAQETDTIEPKFNYSLLKELESKGKWDKYNRRTGMWTDYYADSTQWKESIDRLDAQGNPYPPYPVVLIKGVGKYSNGKREGPWKFYKTYDNRNPLNWDLMESMTFAKGERNGPWKYYYTSGKVMSEANYSSGELDGKFRRYYSDGKLFRVWEYDHGSLEGKSLRYSRSGALLWSAIYHKGYYHGEVSTFYYNGQLQSTVIYNMGAPWNIKRVNSRMGDPLEAGTLKDGTGTIYDYNLGGGLVQIAEVKAGVRTGWVKTYFTNGKINTEVEYRNDTMIGRYKEYYYEGSLYFEGNVRDGQFDGNCKTYYPSGQMQSENIYKAGAIWETISAFGMNGEKLDCGNVKSGSGLWIRYDDSARIYTKSNYSSGSLNGKSEEYYANGKLYSVRYFADDVVEGESTEYREDDGTVQGRYHFVNGVLTGKATVYHRDGKIFAEQFYYQGRLWNMISAYDSLGKKLNTGTLKNGTGILYSYAANGALISSAEMVSGMWHGTRTTYYKSGSKYQEYNYEMNEIRGVSKDYWPNGQVAAEWYEYGNGRTGKMTQWHDNGQLWVIWHWEDGFLWDAEYNKDQNGKLLDKGTFKNGNGTLLRYNQNGEIIFTGHFQNGFCVDCHLDKNHLYGE